VRLTIPPIVNKGVNMSKRSYDRLKNFSTSIAVEKTIAEIEMMLAKYGATKIMKEFDENGQPARLSFAVMTQKGEMPVKLPMNKEGLLNVFKFQVSNGYLPKKFWGTEWANEQVARVGWRIIKDWLDAQLTLLSIEMVKIEEIFLPYIYSPKLDKTMFQVLEDKGFDVEQLEDKRKKIEGVIDG
jgi:hypothetical protein